MHPSAWKANSPKFGFTILHRSASESREDGREDIHRGGPGSTCCGAGWICTILVHRGSTNAVIVSVMVAEKDMQAAGEKRSRKPCCARGVRGAEGELASA